VNIIYKTNYSNINYSLNQSSNKEINLSDLSINNHLNKFECFLSFKNYIFESLAYCLLPNFEGNIFIQYNQKPISLDYNRRRQDIYNHEFSKLPPLIHKSYSLVLDMDETLIHYFDVSYFL